MGSSNSKKEGLAELRGRIDAIDGQIADLLLKRIELSNSIMKSKPSTQIIDSRRENEILARYSQRLSNVSTPAKIERLVSSLLGVAGLYPES